MIVLTNGDQLRLTRNTGSAGLSILVCYRRMNTTTFEAKRELSSVGGSDVVILSNSESGYTYLVESIQIRSSAGTSQVELEYEVSASPVATLIIATLNRGESLHYDHKKGFKKIASSGAIMKTISKAVNPMILPDLAMDVSTANALNNDAVANTLMLFDPGNFWISPQTGTYYFRVVIHYTAQATSCGSRWVFSCTDMSSAIYGSEYSLTTTTRTVNQGMTGNNEPAASNATSASTTSNIAIIEGFLTTTTNTAAFYVKFASEVANTLITAKTKSFFHFIQVA